MLSYDEMGNIKTLNRDNTGAHVYSYIGSIGNQLQSVANVTSTNYVYDANGNATTDGKNGKIISYNYLNLPQTVSGGLTYTYDATGVKLRKNNNGQIRDYVKGIEYQGGNIEIILTEEGVARRNGSTYSYEYNVTDHLGNVRATFYKHPTTGDLDILQRDNYYAFGKRAVVNGGTNKYLYNGKELQEELGQYDYGARFYDAEIGRWNVVDKLADDPMQIDKSPYAYGWNNPVNLTDPDGNCPSCVGAFIGAMTDIALQSVEIALDDNKTFSKDFSYKSVAVSAVAGATGVGLASKIGKLSKIAKLGVELTHDAAAGAVNQYVTEGKVDAGTTLVNATIGKAVGDIAGNAAGKQAAKSPEAKLLAKQADRAERVAANNPRPSRTAAANEATKKASNYVEKRVVAAGTASSGVAGNVVNKVIEEDKKRKQ